MPTKLSTRREFLKTNLAILAAGATVPAFIDQTVWAMANPLDSARVQQPSGKDGKILVVVQLSGGNDGLNTVIPIADDNYHRLRGGIAVAKKDGLAINDYLALNPSLAPVKALYDQGLMQIIQGVGYPNPNRSHFRSMDIWHSAIPERENTSTGWLGRYFDATCTGEDPHAGVCIGDDPLAMQGNKIMPLSFDRPESYRYQGDREIYTKLNTPDAPPAPSTPATRPAAKPAPRIQMPDANSQLNFLERTAMDAQVSSDDILRVTKTFQTAQTYPGGEFGNGLRTIAAMIAGGLTTRVYYVSLGGFDTHANQRGRHEQLLDTFAKGVGAFMADLKAIKADDRVMVMTFSEFGRRVAANASGGTDHGAAAPLFLFGKKLTAGVVGNHPSLTNLDQGDLKYAVDFRSIYATVLQNWLDTPSKPILGQQFATMKLWK